MKDDQKPDHVSPNSRTVGDIVRMEGEAAILWFKQMLNK